MAQAVSLLVALIIVVVGGCVSAPQRSLVIEPDTLLHPVSSDSIRVFSPSGEIFDLTGEP